MNESPLKKYFKGSAINTSKNNSPLRQETSDFTDAEKSKMKGWSGKKDGPSEMQKNTKKIVDQHKKKVKFDKARKDRKRKKIVDQHKKKAK